MKSDDTEYPIGVRVRLVRTNDPYTDLRPGAEGIIRGVSNAFVGRLVNIDWDSGSSLSMLVDESDVIEVIS